MDVPTGTPDRPLASSTAVDLAPYRDDQSPSRPKGDDGENPSSEQKDEKEKTEKEKKPRVKRSRPKIDPKLLVTRKGIRTIFETFPSEMLFQGKGHEREDLRSLLMHYESWALQFFPTYNFSDFIEQTERYSHNELIKQELQRLKNGDPHPDDINRDVCYDDETRFDEIFGKHDDVIGTASQDDTSTLVDEQIPQKQFKQADYEDSASADLPLAFSEDAPDDFSQQQQEQQRRTDRPMMLEKSVSKSINVDNPTDTMEIDERPDIDDDELEMAFS